jgi:hypothetical protein
MVSTLAHAPSKSHLTDNIQQQGRIPTSIFERLFAGAKGSGLRLTPSTTVISQPVGSHNYLIIPFLRPRVVFDPT